MMRPRLFIFIVFIIPFSSIISSENRLIQMGVSPGTIKDTEGDRLVNVNFGREYQKPAVSVYSTFGLYGSNALCARSEVLLCPPGSPESSSEYADLRFTLPLLPGLGFAADLNLFATSALKDPAGTYGNSRLRAGAWFGLSDSFFIGGTVSDHIGFTPASIDQLGLSYSPGVRYRAKSLDVSYSMDIGAERFIDPLEFLVVIKNMKIPGFDPNSQRTVIYSHNLLLRFGLSEKINLENKIHLDHFPNYLAGSVTSAAVFNLPASTLFAGLGYMFFSGFFNYTDSQGKYFAGNFANNEIFAFIGADIQLLSWLKLRAGSKLFRCDILSNNPETGGPYQRFVFLPDLQGGFNFIISDKFNIDLSLGGLSYNSTEPGFHLSLELNMAF